MAKSSEARGYRKYIPSMTRVVQVLVVLIVLKFVIRVTATSIPQNVLNYVPNL